jgi:hydroxymethylglutaryl-CoA lyase
MPTASQGRIHRAPRRAGLRRLEVTSFVNPKKVPQMADAEQVLGGSEEARRRLVRRAGAEPQGFRSRGRRRLQRDRHGGGGERHLQPPQPGRRHRRVDRGLARDGQGRARGGRAAPGHGVGGLRLPVRGRDAGGDRVIEIAKRVAEGNPHEIAFADTIGVGVPSQVSEIIGRAARGAAGHAPALRTSTTPATPGIANAYAAVEAGVPWRWMRAPAASAAARSRRRRPATSRPKTLCTCCSALGIHSGVDLDKLIAIGKLAAADAGASGAQHAGEGGRLPAPRAAGGVTLEVSTARVRALRRMIRIHVCRALQMRGSGTILRTPVPRCPVSFQRL